MNENFRPFPPDDPECELCEAARFTHWYAETADGWIADCEVCSVPMVVWWHHGTEPAAEVSDALFAELGRVADSRFGAGQWQLDANMRQIPTHFHAHARDREWFSQRFSRSMSLYSGVGGPRRTSGGGDSAAGVGDSAAGGGDVEQLDC